jgi:hypothetical protein
MNKYFFSFILKLIHSGSNTQTTKTKEFQKVLVSKKQKKTENLFFLRKKDQDNLYCFFNENA